MIQEVEFNEKQIDRVRQKAEAVQIMVDSGIFSAQQGLTMMQNPEYLDDPWAEDSAESYILLCMGLRQTGENVLSTNAEQQMEAFNVFVKNLQRKLSEILPF